MNLKDEDLVNITKFSIQQVEHITCIECCKYFLTPETASCGHTLCHMCWRERNTCPFCDKPIDRSTLKPNQPIVKLKEDIIAFSNAFEKLFKIKVAEAQLEIESECDPKKNVTAWLANSQNHFSAQPLDSDKFSQDDNEIQGPLNVSSNKIQIHTNTTKPKPKKPEPAKAIIVTKLPQDDWDKIEQMPDTEVINKKGKENIIGPMDIEPFYIEDENQYTVNNPRRSSRKRDLKLSNESNNDNVLLTKQNSKDSIEEADKKSNTAKQNWNNVKRMRKEFSKLNKKNRNKLNVSIEMCKKTPAVVKPCDAFPQALPTNIVIDENTPNDLHKQDLPNNVDEYVEKPGTMPYSETIVNKPHSNTENKIQKTHITSKISAIDGHDNSYTKNDAHKESNNQILYSSNNESTKQVKNAKMPFYKRSSLNPNSTQATVNKIVNHTVDSNNSNDDIEIRIKVGSTITNILIKKKNDMQLKINSEREVQTSPGPHELNEKTSTPINSQAQNIVINVGDNNEIDVTHQPITNPRVEELKKVIDSDKTSSVKKHTDSADTATAQFEITDSVEKELSKIMEIDDMHEPDKTKTVSTEKTSKNESQKTNKSDDKKPSTDNNEKSTKSNWQSQKVPSNIDVNDYINDIDIFDSEPVKEQSVQCLKNTEPAVSEILLSTAKSRNRTQRATEKRCRGANEDALPKSKKAKCDNDTNALTYANAENEPTHNEPDSEPISYDAIMGTVFANIDAEIRESQKINKNTCTLEPKKTSQHNKETPLSPTQKKLTQEDKAPENVENNNQKDSENIFSTFVEKDKSEITVPLASLAEKIPENEPNSNLPEFLTPVTSQVAEDVRLVNDDSDDKSVVEETPQKTSFTKAKHRSNGANMEATQTLPEEPIEKEPSKAHTEDINSIVIVTDISMKSDANETAIDKNRPIETPLNINKFVNQIQHKSTPCAKKSLSFSSQAEDITICATEGVANTTQEREFMLKAFEKTPTLHVKPSLNKSLALKHRRFVIAGSCLGTAEIATLKRLCARNKWTYENKYTSDLTHLVVKVDEENKAQRTIKYMCALAASKWIISYEWVAKCLQTKDPVDEEEYEVLDSTGHPGPMRSRIATKKLFQGIKFFCLEPFGVLDVNSLKEMLIAAGGTVVSEVAAIRLTDKSSGPALLLAELENTQEDRFIYLAMELTVVPVNHEWALNCLGSYSLISIHESLLCPSSLLPKATERWPPELLARDEDDE